METQITLRIKEEIKVNITVLMLDVLIPNYYDELTPVLGIYEENEFKSTIGYWLVSEWLYRQLLAHHQPVVKFKNLYIWGRMGTGYSLNDEEVLITIFGGKN
ncbi:hypothetical protein [Cyanobacterium aponinum]|uniref:Uncharacterized protein n=1 Tax=Cyanobacterium aponinum (strain PCC 10605) TaxID=755178 RepID=K9ZA36_CYAAP|nr:hypothetical protein [Cyanobacterium aponinum]AFZ55582.1 hypothetical protein Cyan10605_3549 [Cyanobacterium aponinum PCC 10605]